MSDNEYTPDFVSPPGETLAEKLEEFGMTQAELAARTGRPKKTINEIIKGKAPITPETALQFERVLGIPARFWNNREQQYRQYLTRLRERERLAGYAEWTRQFSVKAMAERGVIAGYDDPVDLVASLLNFFGLASPEQWNAVWDRFEVAFRKTSAYESGQGDLAAWLRMGELQAQDIECIPYSPERFRKALNRIRPLTATLPEVFQPEVVRLCAEAGVAVTFVPQLPKSRVSGATHWLTPEKALIELSLRYKTNDQLWFTFFHEAGHILLHGKRGVFLENDGQADERDDEADAFAANILIPNDAYAAFLDSAPAGCISKESIREFADRLGIAPGIVVGRLQHDKHLPYTHCNDLKQRLGWV